MNGNRILTEGKLLALTACLATATAMVYVSVLNQNAKWAAYLFIAPFLLLLLYGYKKLHVQIGIVVFLLVFVEKILISQRQPVPFFTVGICLVFLAVVLTSAADRDALPRLLAQRIFSWGLFLVTPLAAILMSHGRWEELFIPQLLNYQVYYLEFFLFFLLGFLTWKAPEKLEALFLILVVVGGLAAAIHLYSINTGFNIEAVRGASEVAENRDLALDKNWRYGGVFGNPNTMSAYYVMFAPVALLMLGGSGSLWRKFVVLGCLTLMILSLFFAGSRGGMVFGVCTGLLALALLRLRARDFFLLIGGALLVLGVTWTAIDHFFTDYFQLVLARFSEKGFDPGVRTEIWYSSWRILLDHPLGIGIHWQIFLHELRLYSSLDFANPHNVYLSLALKGGFLGLAAFLVILWRSLAKCLRVFIDDRSGLRPIAAYCLVAIAGFVLFGLTEPVFSNGFKMNHLLGLVLGIAWAISARHAGQVEAAEQKPLIGEGEEL